MALRARRRAAWEIVGTGVNRLEGAAAAGMCGQEQPRLPSARNEAAPSARPAASSSARPAPSPSPSCGARTPQLGRLFGRSRHPSLKMPGSGCHVPVSDPLHDRCHSPGTSLSRQGSTQPVQRWGCWASSVPGGRPGHMLWPLQGGFVLCPAQLTRMPCGLQEKGRHPEQDIQGPPLAAPAASRGPAPISLPSQLPSPATSCSSLRAPGPGASRPLPTPGTCLEGQCPPVALCVQVPAQTPAPCPDSGRAEPRRGAPTTYVLGDHLPSSSVTWWGPGGFLSRAPQDQGLVGVPGHVPPSCRPGSERLH